MTTEINMTARQQELCLTAAVNHNGLLQPAAEEESLRGGAYFMTIRPLMEKGLITTTENNECLTALGYTSIGLEAPLTKQPTEDLVEAVQSETSETAQPEPEQASEEQPIAKKPRKIRSGTKQAKIIDLLKRPEGASLIEIMEATGWQMHTVRSVLSRTIQKDLGMPLDSEKKTGQARVYFIR